MAQARRKRAGKGRWQRWRRWLWRIPLLFVAVTVMQVAVLRFVDPPFSAFMAARQIEAWSQGDWHYRIAQDWRDLDRMSRSLPLALVAAEDQNFPNHHGFDFDAIAKAQAHNERAIARAEHTLLATGGAGQVFSETTNPPGAARAGG